MAHRLVFILVMWMSGAAWSGEPIAVVTTTTDLQSLVEAVGGDRVRVESLLAPGQDPHVVEMRPTQIARLKRAALIVRIGLDHEPWLQRALQSASVEPGSRRDLDTSHDVALMQTETVRLRADAARHVHGLGNPHYWLDPANARPITAAVLGVLAQIEPAERAHFEANRARFLTRLDAGIARWTAAMAPYRDERIIVVHDSWAYFAARFGLSIVGALEATPGIPPAPSVLATLPALMRSSRVSLLIAEPYSDQALVRQIAARSGVQAVTLVSSVGADEQARDYIALFDLNIERLTTALRSRR